MLRWLGMAGFLLNSRGTTIMIDPLLGDFDMPVLIDFPIAAAAVPRLDAVLITHSDNDHYSVPTCRRLAPVTTTFHSTRYVDTLMRAEGLPSAGHDIGDRFDRRPGPRRGDPGRPRLAERVPRRRRPHLPARGLLRLLDRHPRRHRLGAGRLPTHPRPSPADAHPGRDAVRLLRQRMALRPRRRRRHGERLPADAAAAAPLGLRRRPGLPAVQRRPGLPARPGRQPRPHHPARPRRAVHAAPAHP